MQKAIIGKKIGMTQIFDAKGNVLPVTVVEAGPCVVSQIKTVENDGYEAIQLGFGDIKLKVQNGSGKGKRVRSDKFKNDPVNISKPLFGHFKKADVAPKSTLREFRVENLDSYKVGDIIKADAFAEGDKIDVTGNSKGKGYAGVIKRWNFQRPALSSVGTSSVLKKLTVRVLLQDTAAQWAPAQLLQEFGRARKWQVISEQKRSLYRTLQ